MIFKTVSDLIPKGERFLQTMTFAEKMINADDLDIKANKNSDAYILALTAKHLPVHGFPMELK